MGLGIFQSNAKVEHPGLQKKTVYSDLDVFNFIMLPGIQFSGSISRQSLSEMNIIRVCTEAFSFERFDDYVATVYRLQNFLISKNHNGRQRKDILEEFKTSILCIDYPR